MDAPTPEVAALIPTFSSQTLTIASLSLAIVSIAIFAFLTKRKSAARGTALLVLGPPDAGKTAILSTLVYNQTLPSHTSLQSNTSLVVLPEPLKTFRVIDVPGHPRIRDQFNEHLLQAKAIVFVVDTSTISRNGPAVAEHLHRVMNALISLPPSQTLPSLLILAHKADLLKASATEPSAKVAVTRVRTILERELEKRRVAQTGGVAVEGLGAVGGLAAEAERSDMGGLECSNAAKGAAFRFVDWDGGDVGFVGSSVAVGRQFTEELEKNEKAEEDGLSAFKDWLYDTM